MKKIIIITLCFVLGFSQPYLCCDAQGGVGTMLISTEACSSISQYNCQFNANWVNNGFINWNQITNTPTTLQGYGIKNFPNR